MFHPSALFLNQNILFFLLYDSEAMIFPLIYWLLFVFINIFPFLLGLINIISLLIIFTLILDLFIKLLSNLLLLKTLIKIQFLILMAFQLHYIASIYSHFKNHTLCFSIFALYNKNFSITLIPFEKFLISTGHSVNHLEIWLPLLAMKYLILT